MGFPIFLTDEERVEGARSVMDGRVGAPPLSPIGWYSSSTPSTLMLSTKSIKASVPMTLTFSCTGLSRNIRRNPRPRVCSGKNLAGGGERAQADDGDNVLNVPPFAQHHHRHDHFVRVIGVIDLAA